MRKVVLGLVLAAVAGYLAWTRFQPIPPRLAAALAEARKANKLVLLDFTGSDWCALATKLEAESLTKPEFLDYSAKYLVTLVVDFPMHRALPEELLRDNIALKKRFDVEGFPTLVALSPDGKVVWRQAGFIEGGPVAVITPIDQKRLAVGLPESGGAAGGALAGGSTSTQRALENLASSSANAEATPASQGLPENAPKLQALLYSRTRSSVILGGKQCVEGDTVEGMRVVKILEDRVMVEWEGRTAQLMMH